MNMTTSEKPSSNYKKNGENIKRERPSKGASHNLQQATPGPLKSPGSNTSIVWGIPELGLQGPPDLKFSLEYVLLPS